MFSSGDEMIPHSLDWEQAAGDVGHDEGVLRTGS